MHADADLGSRQAQLASLVSDDRLEIRRLLPAGHNAAVDGENDAGNETRLIGGEKQQRFGCIRRLAIAAKRVHALKVGSTVFTCSGVRNVPYTGVSITAGAIAFTRILSAASSIARFLTSAWTPAFAAE